MKSNLSQITIAVWVGTFALVAQACATTAIQPSAIVSSPALPTPNNPTQPSPIIPTPSVSAPQCIEKIINPTIESVQPSQITPGSEITVSASGGYIQDSCGGFNESARKFDLYLDNELVGNMMCYVNHCETKIILADAIKPGTHCLSTQKDVCEFEFQVMAK